MGLFARLPLDKAAIWSLLGGYLLLPTGTSVDFPLVPPIDKFSITSVTTFLLCWMKGTAGPRPKRSFLLLMIAAIFVIAPIFTSLNNSYELSNANRSIPGFYPIDALKSCLHSLIILAPFFVGLRFLSSKSSRERLLRGIAFAGVLYSLPMLFEVKMSPQLHQWVFGYFPHSFIQQTRDGGFRPVVFLGHGLETALFASLALIASVVAMRARWPVINVRPSVVAASLFVVLLLCKTLGATLYALFAAPLILLTRPRTWLSVGMCLSLMVCAYPLLRNQNLVPIEKILSAANGVSADRASSFQYRIQNEQLLLLKANEKPFFGWGTWGRARVYRDADGGDLTVTDGTWIIQYGEFGLVGYLSLFGLFAIAMFKARLSTNRQATTENMVVGGLGLLLGLNQIDLLLNANLMPFTFLMAGAIAGRVQTRRAAMLKKIGADMEKQLVVAA